jgi:hypothetical protein
MGSSVGWVERLQVVLAGPEAAWVRRRASVEGRSTSQMLRQLVRDSMGPVAEAEASVAVDVGARTAEPAQVPHAFTPSAGNSLRCECGLKKAVHP